MFDFHSGRVVVHASDSGTYGLRQEDEFKANITLHCERSCLANKTRLNSPNHTNIYFLSGMSLELWGAEDKASLNKPFR